MPIFTFWAGGNSAGRRVERLITVVDPGRLSDSQFINRHGKTSEFIPGMMAP
ncbi:MAG: hypothetical protein M1379_15390 [Firmicutes bacterium]|nr:hypothetical protein [Bacillota bacterium]